MLQLSPLLVKLVQRLCADVNTPLGREVSNLLTAGDVKGIARLSCDPRRYDDPEEYFKDALVTNVIRKLNPKSLPKEHQNLLEQECWARFENTERQCALTNARFRRYAEPERNFFHSTGEMAAVDFLTSIRSEIARICGPIPSDLMGRWGPGATLTNPASRSTVPDKFSQPISITRSAKPIWDGLISQTPWWKLDCVINHGSDASVVRGNRFFTVPKDVLKLRGACLSPSGNGFLQLGVGGYLRTRLARFTPVKIQAETLSLYSHSFTAADKHRQLARRGSLDGSLATIDLSDASNTIALEMVRFLFPREWGDLFCALREPFVQRPDGAWQKLEMMSAMGNGFTFELETLLFYAIAKCVVEKLGLPSDEVSTFGDDIVVPTEAAHAVLAVLRFCGFTPNTEKTFVSGPFRESCGGDFFNGTPVRSLYVKEEPTTPSAWFSLANALRALAFGDSGNPLRWKYLRRAWLVALDSIPSNLRSCRGPSYLGDIVLHGQDDEWLLSARERNSIIYARALVPVAKPVSWKHFHPEVQYLSALYGVPSTGAIPRNGVTGYKVRWIPAS